MDDRSGITTVKALLGDYPGTLALKSGTLKSVRLNLEFADVKRPHLAFKEVVRAQRFDIAELAIVTYLQAKAYGKPLVLMPVVVMARAQLPFIVYNAERGRLAPSDLAGRRVGVRALSVTTVTWIRGVLANDYGVDVDRVRWVIFEDPHVAEYRHPDSVERAAAGKHALNMLLDGELDAAIVGEPDLKYPQLRALIPDPMTAELAWRKRHAMTPINHMVVATESLSRSKPWAVKEAYRLLLESKSAAGTAPAGQIDTLNFGVDANRRGLELIIDYAAQQRLIPRRFDVDELFDDVTRALRD